MPLAAVNDVTHGWPLGRQLCDAWVSFDVLCCTSSILHLVAISLDRYWAVTRVDYIHNRCTLLSMAYASFPSNDSIVRRNATHRTAIPPARPPALSDLQKVEHDSNCLRNAGGTPLAAASSCATDIFATFFVERKTLAVR